MHYFLCILSFSSLQVKIDLQNTIYATIKSINIMLLSVGTHAVSYAFLEDGFSKLLLSASYDVRI
jgi:hypothetical protein